MTNQEVDTKKEGSKGEGGRIDKDNRTVPLWTCGIAAKAQEVKFEV